MQSISPDTTTRRILVFLIAWNALDIAIHVIANEVEPLRITSNGILIVVAAAVLLGRAGAHPAHPMLPALLAFVVLNGIVFVDKGEFPIPMTTFVAVSIVSTIAAVRRLRPPPDERRFRVLNR